MCEFTTRAISSREMPPTTVTEPVSVPTAASPLPGMEPTPSPVAPPPKPF